MHLISIQIIYLPAIAITFPYCSFGGDDNSLHVELFCCVLYHQQDRIYGYQEKGFALSVQCRVALRKPSYEFVATRKIGLRFEINSTSEFDALSY